MRRLRVQVLPPRFLNSPANSLHAPPDAIKPFMEPCAEDDTLEDLCHKITERYSRLYPDRPALKIDRLLDGYDTVLEVGDPNFKVGDAFTDSEKTEFVAKFTVKVVPEKVQKPAQLAFQRLDSIPPNSSARPRKRPLGGIEYNARSSLREFMRPADVEPEERPVGYASSNKRPRIGFQEESRRDNDRDRPILSRERDLGQIFSQETLGDHNESVVRLVQDSQQSTFNNGRNQRSPYDRPTSLSRRSSTAVRSARPEFAAVPDSPPTVIRSSIIDGSQPFDALRDEDTKAESPELGQTLHNVPASNFGSPFNGPERAMIDNAEDFLTPPIPPATHRPNGHQYPEHDQYITNPLPSTPQSLTGAVPRKLSLSKLSPQDTSARHMSRTSEIIYKPARDIYDRLATATENSQAHPPTPKTKRLKTSGALSTHNSEHSDNQPLPQREPTSDVHPDSLRRRGSGVTEAELNWLRTQEKSICKPSQGNHDYAIDQAIGASSAVPKEGPMSTNMIDERNTVEDEARENSREAMEKELDRTKDERVERERKAEAERVAKENKEHADYARKIEEGRIAEENRKQAERDHDAEANRIAENSRKQAERDREAEKLRLSKQKADEAAAASKAHEERIAAEAEEKAERKRLDEERKKAKGKQAKERKERERLSAAPEGEQREARAKEAAQDEVPPPRQKANKEGKKAKAAAKEPRRKRKPSPQAPGEKDRKANEAFQRALGLPSSQRRSATPLTIYADTARDGNRGSSTPLIPNGSRKLQASDTPTTSSKGTGLEVQMPLPSALKQSPSTLRRSVSFAKILEPILPRGTTEEDVAKVRARYTPQPKVGSSNAKTAGKAQDCIKTEASGGKVQTKLNVTRDIKLKGRVIDPPAKSKPPVEDKILISSDDEKSASSFHSDSEPDPRHNGEARAGPSSRVTPSARSASAKANVTARMKSIPVPPTSQTKSTVSKPQAPRTAISDDDSIESFRSESEAESRPRSASRSPARYVSQTPASRSISTSEIDLTSSPPEEHKGSTKNSTDVRPASISSSHVPRSGGPDTAKANPIFQPPSTDHTHSQPSQVPSTHFSLDTSQSSEFVQAQTVERDLEAHLQHDISRSSVQPPSSQPQTRTQNHASRASAPPKTNPNLQLTQATKPNPAPPTKPPSTTSTTRTTTTSRFPSLTGLKKNPPKWELKDGAAARMPDFMKPTPKPKTTPASSSQNKSASLFMSPNSQAKYIDLDKSSTDSDDEDESAASSGNDVTIVNGDGHASANANAAAAGAGERFLRNSRTPSTSTPTGTGPRTGATAGTGGRSKYGSALKRMWPFASSSQYYEV